MALLQDLEHCWRWSVSSTDWPRWISYLSMCDDKTPTNLAARAPRIYCLTLSVGQKSGYRVAGSLARLQSRLHRTVVSSQCMIKERAIFKFTWLLAGFRSFWGIGLRPSASCQLLSHGYSQFLDGFWLESILGSLPRGPLAHGLLLQQTQQGSPSMTICNIR